MNTWLSATVDWFLEAHQVAPMQFELGGPWTPISVRDQMIRGQELARRAIREHLVVPGPGGRPLVVIGAGAAGATAALVAAGAGVTTYLFEQSMHAFGRQRGVTTRWLEPYLYDWPFERAAALSYANSSVAVPLPWTAGTAGVAASAWTTVLRAAPLTFHTSSSLVALRVRPRTGTLAIRMNVAGTAATIIAGALVSAIGFGAERTSVLGASGDYLGWRFWENDTITDAFLGHPRRSPPSVLIAGGGDGALQDCIRALIVPRMVSPRGLLAALPPIPDTYLHQIVDAEDHAACAWSWSADKSDDCTILRELDGIVRGVAAAWWGRDGHAIQGALQPLLREDVHSVDLVHPCDHFSRGYVLNRFLVYLLELLPSVRLRRIAGQGLATVHGGPGHSCGTIGRCRAVPHAATLTAMPCADRLPAVPPVTGQYDLVIPRLSPIPPAYVFGGAPTAPRRQLLPARPLL